MIEEVGLEKLSTSRAALLGLQLERSLRRALGHAQSLGAARLTNVVRRAIAQGQPAAAIAWTHSLRSPRCRLYQ
ncbi:hypothetical protein [Rubidibacter lacunae]|uniref:hypothetical protein n=1 Tax=Rubidibacter lacunae TaxID=582514 RepID=UPI0003F8BED5|nr:hypothetical protein [Rubidibacter lacunae]